MFSKDIDKLQIHAQKMTEDLICLLKKKEIFLEEAIEVILVCYPILYLKDKPLIEEAIKLFFDRICEEHGDMNDLNIQTLMMAYLVNSELIDLNNAAYLFTGAGTNMAKYWRDYVTNKGLKMKGGDKNHQRMILILDLLRSKMNAMRFKKFRSESVSKEDIEMYPHTSESMRAIGHSWAMATIFKELQNAPSVFLADCCSETTMFIKDASKKGHEQIAEEIFSKIQKCEEVKSTNPESDYTNLNSRYLGLGIFEKDDVLWVTVRYRQK
ncbi:MAG: hypothetical protein PHN74_02085 [Candidatus Pacebacteria bacterium]|nr:hypothetical protein [Candidatus Paceibacterota bacterium]